MSFSQSVFDKKEEFYKRFASDFFTKEAWKKMSSYDPKISGFLCGFYTVIKTRCDLDDAETSKLVYKSLKSKCSGMPSYDKFKNVLDENMSKTGFKSFFNKDIKTSMEAFEALYLQWELKMVDEGFVENY